ncbi:MAG TPA: hypothetical protein VET23_08945 [Chitinophagaceae bacterium]|nr:hypothetical protein [Chitinophagaceae bacterium]
MKYLLKSFLISLTIFFIIHNTHAQVNNFDYSILRSIAKERTPEKNAFYKFVPNTIIPFALRRLLPSLSPGLLKTMCR